MQQREQLILKKLAEAREVQAGAMTRFIQARARVMQVEARLQTLRARLASPQTSPTQPPDDTVLPAETLSDAESLFQAEATPSPLPLTEQLLHAPATLAPSTEQTISEQETVPLVFEQPLFSVMEEDEPQEEEETQKRPAIQLVSPSTEAAESARHQREEEETLIIARSALREHAQSEQIASNGSDVSARDQQPVEEGSAIQETSGTDITAKMQPVRNQHDDSQEPA